MFTLVSLRDNGTNPGNNKRTFTLGSSLSEFMHVARRGLRVGDLFCHRHRGLALVAIDLRHTVLTSLIAGMRV